MTYTYKISVTTVFACALLLSSVQFASAQEVFDVPKNVRPASFEILKYQPLKMKDGVEADKEARINAQNGLKEERDALRTRQLDIKSDLRVEHVDMQRGIQADADAHRAEIKAQLDAATTPEERQNILDTARAERDALHKAALEKRKAFRDRAEATRAELKENRAEFKVAIKSEVGANIKVHLERILERIASTLDSFVSILDRINNKIAELDAEGVDTSTVTSAAENAEIAINTATTALHDARVEFEAALSAENPRDHLEDVKTAVRTASQNVKEAHRELKDAVMKLKELIRSVTNITTEVEASAEIQ